jgi:hypothetical protein
MDTPRENAAIQTNGTTQVFSFLRTKTIFDRDDDMLTLIMLLTFTWPEATALHFALQSA